MRDPWHSTPSSPTPTIVIPHQPHAFGHQVSFEHKKNDVLAVDAFRDFEAEIHSWKWKGGLSEPPHRLGAFADYLSERYMCQRLDPLRGSAVVTSIRKR